MNDIYLGEINRHDGGILTKKNGLIDFAIKFGNPNQKSK
jgi:hypothetical protein